MIKNKFIYFYCGLICCLLFFPAVIFAESQKLKLFSPPPNSLRVEAYIDGSYNYLLRSNRFVNSIYDRVNDLNQNGFTLQQAALTIIKSPTLIEPLGGLLSAIAGRDAYNIAPLGLNADVFNSSTVGLTIAQAYLRYKINNNINIKFGDMLSLAGIEIYFYPQVTNFSRGILYGYAQPGTHMGIRDINRINQQWVIVFGIANGWNTVRQSGQIKAGEAGIVYTPNNAFSMMIDLYGGSQYLTDLANSGLTGERYLWDAYGSWFLNKNINLMFNYNYGWQNRATLANSKTGFARWQGIALYLNTIWTDTWRTSIRGEIFNDPQGYRTGVNQTWNELTLTLAYFIRKDFQIRAETRHDFANTASFLQKNRLDTSNNQQSYALELLLGF